MIRNTCFLLVGFTSQASGTNNKYILGPLKMVDPLSTLKEGLNMTASKDSQHMTSYRLFQICQASRTNSKRVLGPLRWLAPFDLEEGVKG